MEDPAAPLSFQVFLSHRYKSTDVNLYFFDLLSEAHSEVQFKVDEGLGQISMTRLERMVRDADAFVGIYPFPGPPDIKPELEELRKASQYFRLEMDLAIRSGKPAIVFYDQRYKAILPRASYCHSYNPQELAGHGGNPTRHKQAKAVQTFRDTVQRAREYRLWEPRELSRQENRVGVLLPVGDMPGAYPREHVEELRKLIGGVGYECEPIDVPASLTPEFLLQLWEFDWILVDVGSTAQVGEIVGLLHGQFIPMLRVKHVEGPVEAAAVSPLERALYGAFEVGYDEDTVVWHDLDSLLRAVETHLKAIESAETYISSVADAHQYFEKARKRKARVFLSYSGDNQAEAAALSDALADRFQEVWDYRKKAIRVGQFWYDELVSGVAKSQIGVPLLSSSYLKRPVCMDEARRMVERRVNGDMEVLPVNLDDVLPPATLESIQFARWADFADPRSLVDHMVGQLPPER